MYNCLILGAGKMAAHYDNPMDVCVQTHAHAIKQDKRFNLLGFYDTSFEKSLLAAQKWDVNAFLCASDAGPIDVAIICTPDHCHAASVKQALTLSPKLIFLEKPIASNRKDAEQILTLSSQVPIIVNFSRRFSKTLLALSTQIRANVFGQYQGGIGYYNKGFRHNGSHLIDLIRFLLDEVNRFTTTDEFCDYTSDDPTKSGILKLQSGKNIFLQGVPANQYELFELDILFSTARIRLLDGGRKVEIYRIQENEHYIGYKNLVLCEILDTDINHVLENAYSGIAHFLDHGEVLHSSIQDAFTEVLYE